MARAKIDKRRRSSNKTRAEKCKRSSYNNYDSSKWNSKLLSAMQYILTSGNFSAASKNIQYHVQLCKMRIQSILKIKVM